MSQFGAHHQKTPWGRPAVSVQQQLNPQLFTTGQLGLAAAAQQLVPQAVQLPGGLNIQNLGGTGMLQAAGINAAAFSQPQATLGVNALSRSQQPGIGIGQQQQTQGSGTQNKNQRAFVGVVTKMQDNYGFVDDDVFFQTSVVRGAMPRVGERVMVEANYNPNMPFKWNAFRIQLLPNQDQPGGGGAAPAPQHQPPQMSQPQHTQPHHQSGGGGGALGGRQRESDRWGPPAGMGGGGGSSHGGMMQASAQHAQPQDHFRTRDRSPIQRRRERTPPRRPTPPERRRSPPPRRRSPSPRRHGSVQSVSSQSQKRERTSPRRASSPARDRAESRDKTSRSPPRRRARTEKNRYFSLVPKVNLDVKQLTLWELKKRYHNMYIPSDFFHSNLSWQFTFPPNRPFSLDHQSTFHILHKDVDPLSGERPTLDPPDADHKYCAKVMLLATPSLKELYQKTLCLKEDGTVDEDGDPANFNRYISFLVGNRGKNEVLAIGGPWSPSLDGQNPESDPGVLVKTAIRTTKALTGIDLSKCTQWYKFLDLKYRRGDKQPTTTTTPQTPGVGTEPPEFPSPAPAVSGAAPKVDSVVIFIPDIWNLMPTKLEFEAIQAAIKEQLAKKIEALDKPVEEKVETPTPQAPPVPAAGATDATSPTKSSESKEEAEAAEESEDAKPEGKGGPTHWSNLDFKTMKVVELREELAARGLDTKGVKVILVSRLQEAAKKEEESETGVGTENKPAAEAPPGGSEEKLEEKMETSEADTQEKKEGEEKSEIPSEDQVVVLEELKDEDSKPEAEQQQPSEEEKKKQEEEEQKKKEAQEKEEQKKKEKEEKEKKEKKAELERHYEMKSSITPSILVHPHKTAKGGKFGCNVVSLKHLLEYSKDDNKEHSFEVAMFAEAFTEMITRDCAFSVYKALHSTPGKEAEALEKKRKEAAAKAAEEQKKKEAEEAAAAATAAKEVKTEEPMDSASVEVIVNGEPEKKEEGGTTGTAGETQAAASAAIAPPAAAAEPKKEEKKLSKEEEKKKAEEEKKKLMSVVSNPDLLFAFANFDKSMSGYLTDSDLEEIFYSLGLNLTRAQIQKLLKKVSTREMVNYRKFVETVMMKDTKEVKTEPQWIPVNEKELAIGNTELVQVKAAGDPSAKASNSGQAPDVTDSPNVYYQGSIVNVSTTLEQLTRLDKEQHSMELRNKDLEKELKSTKERVATLEKKKRRLEDDSDRYKKRYQDAEKCLKTSQDDTVLLKTALQECKKLSEKVAYTVDKALPVKEKKKGTDSPKADSKATPKKDEKKEESTANAGQVNANPSASQSSNEAENKPQPVQEEESRASTNDDENNPEEMIVHDEIVENEAPEADMAN